MVTVLVFLALVCFVLASFPKVQAKVVLVSFFNLGVAFLVAALLVSLGGATIRIG